MVYYPWKDKEKKCWEKPLKSIQEYNLMIRLNLWIYKFVWLDVQFISKVSHREWRLT